MKTSRPIEMFVIHCSATPPDMDIGAKEVEGWHVNPKDYPDGSVIYRGKTYASRDHLPAEVRKAKGNGWSEIGYHYVIRRNGAIEVGRDLGRPGAHAQNFNAKSIGICLVGGLNKQGAAQNNFTPEQFAQLGDLIGELQNFYPHAQVLGHRDLPGVKKDCPCFNVRRWCDDVGIKHGG